MQIASPEQRYTEREVATGGASARQSTLRFGEFELDFTRRLLSREGIRLKLQNQPFQVLSLLLQRAPAVVSRDEIRERVWGDNVHVDVERNINFCIRQVRGVLLDDASTPRFIETIPREGYRFIAPLEGDVERETPAQNGSSTDEHPVTGVVDKPAPNIRLPILIAIPALLAVVAVAFWLLKKDVQTRVYHISPVTSYTGDEREPSLSPDGRQVAFSWNGEDERFHIYVKLLGEQRPLRLTQDAAEDDFPAWSPDGKQIAFMRRRTDSESDIVTIPSIGGTERILHRVLIGRFLAASGRMMAWSPDGKWLCFTSESGASTGHALWLLSLDSGIALPLFAASVSAGGESSPAISPDGHWLAFATFTSPSTSKIFFQRLTSKLEAVGEPIPVANTSGSATSPVWLPDSKHILFLDHAGSGISQARIGGAANMIYVSGAKLDGLTLDALGAHLIAARGVENLDIETVPLQGLKVAGAAQLFVHTTASESQPRYSPDGNWMAFKSDRSGASEIWLAREDGENVRQLTHIGAYVAGYPKWSSDSAFLVFHARLPDEGQIYTIRLRDGLMRQITHETPGFADASFSGDGKTIYMIRNVAVPHLYRVSVKNLTLQPLWPGCCAMEAPSRGLVLYAKLDQAGIYARSIEGNPVVNPEIRLIADYLPEGARFTAFDDGIYYVASTPTGQPRAFRFYSFASGQSVDIAPTPPNYCCDISVAPDRTRLAYTTEMKGSQDLMQFDLSR